MAHWALTSNSGHAKSTSEKFKDNKSRNSTGLGLLRLSNSAGSVLRAELLRQRYILSGGRHTRDDQGMQVIA
jgi:hypothetical protein